MSYNYNIEKSIVDTGLPTTYRSLDPNSPQNQQLTEADVLAAKSAMQKLLNEVQIRFDNDPKFLTKRDFGKLIELLQSSFGWLYSVPQFKQIIDDWIDYYNNDRYQWDLAKLSPNEFYNYIITGNYPLPKGISKAE